MLDALESPGFPILCQFQHETTTGLTNDIGKHQLRTLGRKPPSGYGVPRGRVSARDAAVFPAGRFPLPFPADVPRIKLGAEWPF